MKKKLAIIGTIALLGVGGFTVFSLNNPDWRANTILATARDKQLAWLKEHEEEIVKWVHSKYPKLYAIQFDWDTIKVVAVGNGVFATEYNLSIKGKFNDNLNTILIVDFKLDKKDSIPNMSNIRLNHPPRIKRDGGIFIYE